VKRCQTVVIMLLLCSGLFSPVIGRTERNRPIRIGALTAAWGPTPMIVGLRDGLLDLGYREDEDFVLGVRFTQGDLTALTDAARELVSYEVDLIFTSEDAPAIAAQHATRQIPIVFASVSDPVGMGLVQSFAQPGGNVTGVTDLSFELGAKRLELLREMVPNLQRTLVPYDANSATALATVKAYREAAHRLGIVMLERPIRTMEEARTTLAQVHEDELISNT
jgi:putative ABC transport system substrate-binding protein